MSTARTIHRYTADPIPDEHIAKIMYAATRAPSGTNRQPARFLVLRDGERAKKAKAMMGESFRKGWNFKSGDEGWKKGSGENPDSLKSRTAGAIQQFVDNFEQIPVVILVCFIPYREPQHQEGASVFPACQNILLASRALGYGACFSGWHMQIQDELKALLEIPQEVILSLTITVGKPEGNHGPLRRLPVQHLIYDDGWESPAQWVQDPPDARLSRVKS
ncbi:MAG: nitroreductase family protein [Pseudomonadota bacterium]